MTVEFGRLSSSSESDGESSEVEESLGGESNTSGGHDNQVHGFKIFCVWIEDGKNHIHFGSWSNWWGWGVIPESKDIMWVSFTLKDTFFLN